MSFILDALKKSESDRQRQSGPSLFEVKVAPPRRTLPLWAAAIAVLLGINVVVISWMLLRHPAPQQAATVGAAAAPPTTTVNPAAPGGAAPTSAPGGPAAGGGERADPTSGSGPGALPPGIASGTTLSGAALGSAPAGPAGAARAAAPAAPSDTAPGTLSASAPGAPSAAALSAAARAVSSGHLPSAAPRASGADQSDGQPPASDNANDDAPAVEPAAVGSGGAGAGGLPIYQQIVANDGLPALHLDLHVFADRPKDRFVMINMHRLGEGDSLPSGVQVDAIRPDGVVLTYHGTRFLLPRN